LSLVPCLPPLPPLAIDRFPRASAKNAVISILRGIQFLPELPQDKPHHTLEDVSAKFDEDAPVSLTVPRIAPALAVLLCALAGVAPATHAAAAEKVVWKPVQFAIVRYNDDAPASWNMYHGEKKGVLLLRLWRRYLLVNVQEQEVYELDPDKVKMQGDNIEWSPSDVPPEPIETSEWKARDVGPMRRVKFRFGKTGNFLDIQLPLLVNGKPAY
jgi:hypothetical protein